MPVTESEGATWIDNLWAETKAVNAQTTEGNWFTRGIMTDEITTMTNNTGLNTYIEEMRMKFIRGDADIETEWDTYVETCEKLGIDNGETILLTHDCTLPRPYSRGGRIQGTKGIWMEDPHAIYIEDVSPNDEKAENHQWEPDASWLARFAHPLWSAYDEFGTRGGHDGMDYLVLRAFVESVQRGIEPPIDVYDTALWMSITCLSEQSVAQGGALVAVPDFTDGSWACCGQRDSDSIYLL